MQEDAGLPTCLEADYIFEPVKPVEPMSQYGLSFPIPELPGFPNGHGPISSEIVKSETPRVATWGVIAAPSSMTDTKPTNPKDIVGIRKAPMSTVSAAVMAEVGVAMLEGALKYGRHNYRKVGVRASVYYDGTMRHLMDWWEGCDTDPDSGMHHITKAITSLVVLRDAMLQGKCEDDRPPISAPFYGRLNDKASALMDKYADRHPKHYTIAD